MTVAAEGAAATIPIFTGRLPASNPFAGAGAAARSLNRARLMALPDIAGTQWIGRSASEMLSAAAVTALVRAAAGPLRLDPDAPDLWHDLDSRFDHPATRPAALAVATEAGRRLGALLLALWRGDVANHVSRPEWSDAHWRYWRAVRRVVVGGGLLAGRLGEAAVPSARALLAAAGCPIAVERSPYGDAIALVGLARHAPADLECMLLFDFGHSTVKSGLATYRDGALDTVARRPSSPAPCEAGWPEHAGLEWARARWERMAAAIVAAWTGVVPPVAGERVAIGLSLASHLQDGHPVSRDRGCYAALGVLAPHLATFVRDDLAARLGRFRSLALLHDGLAAASTRAGEAHTVVLTLGTSIGTGYAPVVEGLRPFAAQVVDC